MCGIIGYSTTGPKIDLTLGLRAMVHRGPDGVGAAYDEAHGIGLGHARLAIIDTSDAGHQPMVDASRRFTITYNGELYDIEKRRVLLKDASIPLRGMSDTEVLLNHWALCGLGALTDIDGIFAFAICDHDTGELTLVRDAFGVKPVYYIESDEGFFSRVKLRR
jgi:asparagine synthase (glutamine-hydrolysing)